MSGSWQGSTRRSRLPADWPSRRARVLARDGHRCTWRDAGKRCPASATDVDHVRPGDDHDEGNLRALCSQHHRRKTSREGTDALLARGTRARAPEPHPGLIRRE